jgi:hypothetical protein
MLASTPLYTDCHPSYIGLKSALGVLVSKILLGFNILSQFKDKTFSVIEALMGIGKCVYCLGMVLKSGENHRRSYHTAIPKFGL